MALLLLLDFKTRKPTDNFPHDRTPCSPRRLTLSVCMCVSGGTFHYVQEQTRHDGDRGKSQGIKTTSRKGQAHHQDLLQRSVDRRHGCKPTCSCPKTGSTQASQNPSGAVKDENTNHEGHD